MIEFAFVISLLFIGLFAAIASAFYAMVGMGAITVAENSVRQAIQAAGSKDPPGPVRNLAQTLNIPRNKDKSGATIAMPAWYPEMVARTKTSLPGTKVVDAWAVGGGFGAPGPNCPTPAQVKAAFPSGPTIAMCVVEVNRPGGFNDPCWASAACPGPAVDYGGWQVQVHVTGCASILVPLIKPFDSCQGGIVLDEIAVIHPLVFQ